jgi:hypothetical protein
MRRPSFGWGDNVHFNTAVLKLAREKGLDWHLLTFDARAELIRQYRKTLPKPAPSKPPWRELNGGESPAIGGGTGRLLETGR